MGHSKCCPACWIKCCHDLPFQAKNTNAARGVLDEGAFSAIMSALGGVGLLAYFLLVRSLSFLCCCPLGSGEDHGKEQPQCESSQE